MPHFRIDLHLIFFFFFFLIFNDIFAIFGCSIQYDIASYSGLSRPFFARGCFEGILKEEKKNPNSSVEEKIVFLMVDSRDRSGD